MPAQSCSAEDPLDEVYDAFARSENLLNLEIEKKDVVLEQKQEMRNAIQRTRLFYWFWKMFSITVSIYS